MAAGHRALLVLLAATAAPGATAARALAGAGTAANPIRRVVTMLQMMQQKVTAEGQKEEKLVNKFMCYCDTGTSTLKSSIEKAEGRLPELESSIKESAAEVERLKGDVGQAKADRADASQGLTEGKGIAEKEHAAFLKEAQEYQANIKALDKAIKALQRGLSSTFLQTSAASTLRQLSLSLDMTISDRELISAFLSNDHSEYRPQTSEVLGILKQMKEEMEIELSKMTAKNNSREEEAKSLMKAKSEQILALSKQVDSKVARIGELQVDVANLQGDFDDTSSSLQEDRTFLAHLQKGCSKHKSEWSVRQKLRAEELQAISSAIKVLNDDEALTLFKKTLPTPSLLQMHAAKSRSARQQALQAVNAARRRGSGQHSPRLSLITMALRARRSSFDKVIRMVDDMVRLLAKEQVDDENKKTYCKTQLDQTEDQLRELNLDISDLGKAIEEAKQKIGSLTEEVATLGQSIQQLDQQVSESTGQRKQEHMDYVEQLGTNSATQELLHTAKNILNKFYNPKLYKAQNPEEEEFFAQLSTGRGGGSGAQLPPPPEGFGGRYEKQHEGSSGVIAMMDNLMEDLSKESQELELSEREAQKEYEEATADAAAKRAIDARTVAEKEAVKAEQGARLHKMVQEQKSKSKEASSAIEYQKDVHSECDWLLANFDIRKQAREGETESLRQAKAVLSGADYSLAQMPRRAVGS